MYRRYSRKRVKESQKMVNNTMKVLRRICRFFKREAGTFTCTGADDDDAVKNEDDDIVGTDEELLVFCKSFWSPSFCVAYKLGPKTLKTANRTVKKMITLLVIGIPGRNGMTFKTWNQ